MKNKKFKKVGISYKGKVVYKDNDNDLYFVKCFKFFKCRISPYDFYFAVFDDDELKKWYL